MGNRTALSNGVALPDDNAHSPNEKFDLDCFANAQLVAAYLWQNSERDKSNAGLLPLRHEVGERDGVRWRLGLRGRSL
jgi:hypothetical protein